MLLRNWYVYRMIKENFKISGSSGGNKTNLEIFSQKYSFKAYDSNNDEDLLNIYISSYYSTIFNDTPSICGETTQYDLNTYGSYEYYKYLYPVVGNGNTPVNFDDRSMSNLLCRSDGWYKTLIGGTITRKITEESTKLSISFLCMALKDMTIREIGLQCGIPHASNIIYPILLIREVLETPIEAKANQTFTVSFDIDMPYPSILETPIGENPEG